MGHQIRLSHATAAKGSRGEKANHQRTDRASPAAERRTNDALGAGL